MADELEQLDEIVESDILDALGEKPSNEVQEEEIKIEDLEESAPLETSLESEEEITIEDFEEDKETSNEQKDVLDGDPEVLNNEEKETLLEPSTQDDIIEAPQTPSVIEQHTVEMESSSIASLLSELLKNKTLEITIKIKD